MMYYHLTRVSANRKVGPIPVSTVSNVTCPDSCPLKANGCYAEGGPLNIHWRKVSKGLRGGSFEAFLKLIRSLPRGQMWRHAQAGDLPGEGDRIDRDQMIQLASANQRRPVIAYSHKPPTEDNISILREAQELGFSVNLSADTLTEADELAKTGLPVVVILPQEYQKREDENQSDYHARLHEMKRITPAGRKIAVCPATYTETNCAQCGACAKPSRTTIIGFPAHGSRRSVVSTLVNNG